MRGIFSFKLPVVEDCYRVPCLVNVDCMCAVLAEPNPIYYPCALFLTQASIIPWTATYRCRDVRRDSDICCSLLIGLRAAREGAAARV